jgi:hypothetical protein
MFRGHEPNLRMTEAQIEHFLWWRCSYFFASMLSGPTSTRCTYQTAESTSTTNRHKTLKSTIMCLSAKHTFKLQNLELKVNMSASNAHTRRTTCKWCQMYSGYWRMHVTFFLCPHIVVEWVTLLPSIREIQDSNSGREMSYTDTWRKAKHIHKRQIHLLVIENVTERLLLQEFSWKKNLWSWVSRNLAPRRNDWR